MENENYIIPKRGDQRSRNDRGIIHYKKLRDKTANAEEEEGDQQSQTDNHRKSRFHRKTTING